MFQEEQDARLAGTVLRQNKEKEFWRKKEVRSSTTLAYRATSAQARSAVFREIVLGLAVREGLLWSRINDITAPFESQNSIFNWMKHQTCMFVVNTFDDRCLWMSMVNGKKLVPQV